MRYCYSIRVYTWFVGGRDRLWSMSRYKYYIKKPKSEIAKDILIALAISGAVAITSTSPYFGVNLARSLFKRKKYAQKKTYDAFYRLKRQGYIEFQRENKQLYITLTEEGEKRAGIYQINRLEIKKPKKWDRKWRLVLFDIQELQRTKREAFRGILHPGAQPRCGKGKRMRNGIWS